MVKSGKSPEDRGLRDTKFLAKFFDRTERNIQQLAKDGILRAEKIKGNNYYELIPSIQSYIKYLQEIVDRRKKTSEDQEQDRLEAEIRYKKAKATEAELKLEVVRARLLRAEDVQDFVTDLAMTTKSLLTALPGRLSLDVLNAGNANEASEIIEKALGEVLTELRDYEFNIEYYKKKVAETRGRDLNNGEEDDEDE